MNTDVLVRNLSDALKYIPDTSEDARQARGILANTIRGLKAEQRIGG